MSWKDTIKKKTDTATRSAELWTMNDEDAYRKTLSKIKSLVLSGNDKEEVIGSLAIHLANIMAHNKGFMEELEREDYDGTTDSINEVDWEKIARNFEEDIDTILDDYA